MKYQKHTEEEIQNWARLYKDEGWTGRRIAEELGVKESVVKAYLQKRGVRVKPEGMSGRRKVYVECKTPRQISRRWWLSKQYNITPAEYDRMLTAQNGGCKLCGSSRDKRYAILVVDHCHETGRIRGLLCNKCNLAIGQFQDDPALLRKALAYLEGN